MSGFDLSSALAKIPRGRPLVIVDADEVILRFVDGFDRFLRVRGLYLDLTSYRLHGNVKSLADNAAVLDVEVTALLTSSERSRFSGSGPRRVRVLNQLIANGQHRRLVEHFRGTSPGAQAQPFVAGF